MKKMSKRPALLSGIFGIFKSKPTKTSMKSAQRMRARVQQKHGKHCAGGQDSPYRAAEIVVKEGACDTAKALAGTRFLMREVPHIPVVDCVSRRCTCTYLHHSDRRNKDGDRRAHFDTLTSAYVTTGHSERRGSRGRRADDRPLGQLR
ncbi:Uncharacterised protein [Halioglobus japonicus]|nr:Uncharacterised protein [Halioglobus japonicus]